MRQIRIEGLGGNLSPSQPVLSTMAGMIFPFKLSMRLISVYAWRTSLVGSHFARVDVLREHTLVPGVFSFCFGWGGASTNMPRVSQGYSEPSAPAGGGLVVRAWPIWAPYGE